MVSPVPQQTISLSERMQPSAFFYFSWYVYSIFDSPRFVNLVVMDFTKYTR